jgi:aryl-alcohol dehydrogenase-like predicted oxidoreductase
MGGANHDLERRPEMQKRKLGSDGPEITVVGFGAWESGGDMWGPNESEQQVIDAIRSAIDAGMSWIDTAEVYGDGRSEELVGKAIAGRRDEVLIFTKVAPRENGGGGTGVRPEQVHEAIEKSLRRLGVEHVDLYQVHWPDSSGVPIGETWGALAEVQDEGLARHIGLSNFDRSDIERCEAIHHVDSVQNQFSLLHRDDRPGLLPWLAERGIGYLAYGPLAFGLLTGAIHADTPIDDWRGTDSDVKELFGPGARERHLEKVDRMRPIAERRGTSLSSLALAWVVAQPGVTAAIAGSRNPDHVRSNAQAGDIALDEETLRELDEIFG